jgi:hypothetical protein
MSLTRDDIAVFGEVILGRELSASDLPRSHPATCAPFSRLANLHKAADHLAKTVPDILAAPEAAQAPEQALAEAMMYAWRAVTRSG